MQGKIAAIVARKQFMAMLSDGRQARKTGNEKELVLAQVEKNSIPVYSVFALLEMEKFSGADAVSLKKSLDAVFESGNVLLLDYQTKVMIATYDNTNVNLGMYSGSLIMMKENRALLITIHCASHRLGFALKDAVKEISKFAEHDKFYTNMFYLCKSFIKLKTETKNTAAAQNISYYTLHKVHGTSFLNHRRRCFKNLLHNWPALITGYGNFLANGRGSSTDTRARIRDS